MASSSASVSPSRKARIAGAFYAVTFAAGTFAAMSSSASGSAGTAALLVSSAAYVGVTVLLYRLFKPVSATMSLVGAIFSLTGSVVGALSALHVPMPINSLVFFGLYCLSIGYLILRSTFLPRTLGVLLLISGIGWLTFVSPELAHRLSPFNMLPGVVGEGALMLWLLIAGVDDRRW